MKDKRLEQAARDHRVAVLPEWLQRGREVWYWRECLCEDDGCMDMTSVVCPLNRGEPWYGDDARLCSSLHPVLDHSTIWDVSAAFTPRGVEWIINDLEPVADCRLRQVFYEDMGEAMANKPGRVERDG